MIGFVLAQGLACADPNAPPTVAYDHVACDHCGMLVGDPASTAVLVDRDGNQRNFDDPGCLFSYIVAEHPQIAKLWFFDGQTWYREDEVAFTTDANTPMGSGLHAVPAGTPGAIGFGEASSRAVSR